MKSNIKEIKHERNHQKIWSGIRTEGARSF